MNKLIINFIIFFCLMFTCSCGKENNKEKYCNECGFTYIDNPEGIYKNYLSYRNFFEVEGDNFSVTIDCNNQASFIFHYNFKKDNNMKLSVFSLKSSSRWSPGIEIFKERVPFDNDVPLYSAFNNDFKDESNINKGASIEFVAEEDFYAYIYVRNKFWHSLNSFTFKIEKLN